MATAKLAAQHFLMVSLIASNRGVPRWTFHGVDFRVRVSAANEFPVRIPTVDFYARFLVMHLGPADLRVRVEWIEPAARPDQSDVWLGRRTFAGSGGYQDELIRYANFQVWGVGRHRVTLSQRRTKWRVNEWRRLATDFFCVEQHS